MKVIKKINEDYFVFEDEEVDKLGATSWRAIWWEFKYAVIYTCIGWAILLFINYLCSFYDPYLN